MVSTTLNRNVIKRGGCSEKSDDQKCTVSKIKHRYEEAGIVTIEDRKIAKKIVKLYDLYLAIKKKKSLTTELKGGH